jgi:hypothetical protein
LDAWFLVSGQLYYTISSEGLFVFGNKKCRIYAALGVLQTPNYYTLGDCETRFARQQS